MNHFLEKCAEHIFNQHKINELADISVILPTRRGTLMLKKSLGKQSKKPFIAPHIIAIEDFILENTNLRLMEPIDLVFELFNSIKEEDESVKFELFMSWAPTLLKDFESIDQYLVNAKQLFSYMTEAKAMERWNISELKSGDKNFETSVEKYFALFKTLHSVYENFNKTLISKGFAYRGSAYRFLAENADTILLENPKYKKYYFIGFNALSLSEGKIINSLIKAKKAEMLWDTDDYYMGNMAFGQLAGKFLKSIKKEVLFGKDWKWQENELLTGTKNIKIIGLDNSSSEPIVAANFLECWAKEKTQNKSTALILADETMLDAVTNHIPEAVGNYNITMGLTLKASPIYNLLESIFDILGRQKSNKKEESEYNNRLIIKLLNHIYVKKWFYINNVNLPLIINNIQNENLLFSTFDELRRHFGNLKLTEAIFTDWRENPTIAVKQLKIIIKILFESNESNSAIELQFLGHFNKTLNRVEEIVFSNISNISIAGLKSILFEILRQTKLPFESNAHDNLQIMGMLETRTLDFERVILLSANEGNLPSGKKNQSLIPFDALKELNLPTYGHQDAIMAYHFFRLLQRAKEVVIIYTKPNPANGNKEKSRFILQIEHELAKLNRNITIEHLDIDFDFEKNLKIDSDFQIEKTDEIITKIKNELVTKGLFATAFNEYISCEMRYYFNRIAKVKEPNDIDESIGNDIFGSWVHKTLENIDIENLKKGGIVEKETLIELKKSLRFRLETEFKNAYPHLSLKEGMNHILLNIAEKILDGYWSNQINNEEFPQKTLDVEMNLVVESTLKIIDDSIKIRVGGKIDKVNKIGNTINIIDYKTGKVEGKNLLLKSSGNLEDDIEIILTKPELDKFRQLWLYRYIFLKGMAEHIEAIEKLKLEPNLAVRAGIYSFRNNKNGFMIGPNFLTNSTETAEEFISISETILEKFVTKLLDKNMSFKMTHQLKICEYCSFKSICNR